MSFTTIFFTSLSRDYMHFKKKEAGNAEEFIIIQIVYSFDFIIFIFNNF